jgi:Spy/CpxP family protein refolding chaperone
MTNTKNSRFSTFHASNPAVLNRMYEVLTPAQREQFDLAREACSEAGVRRDLQTMLVEVAS